MGTEVLTPAHLHVAVNHLPLIGLAATLIPLLYGLIRREMHTLRVGFLMCVLFGGATTLVMFSGEEADEDIEHGSKLGTLLDTSGRHWLHEHEERAEAVSWAAYATAALGLAGLLVQWKRPQFSRPFAALALVFCMVSVLGMIWVAQAGGRISHPEFRSATSRP